MKTVSINLFSFDELNDKAKKKAIDWHAETFDSSWIYEEFGSSLKALCDIHPYFKATRYNTITVGLNNDIKGARLYKWISNNLSDRIYSIKPKAYEKNGKKHTSKIQFVKSEDAVLTGHIYDFTLLEPIYDFMKKPIESISLSRLIDRGVKKLTKEVEEEVTDSIYGEQALADLAELGDAFLENGSYFYPEYINEEQKSSEER